MFYRLEVLIEIFFNFFNFFSKTEGDKALSVKVWINCKAYNQTSDY